MTNINYTNFRKYITSFLIGGFTTLFILWMVIMFTIYNSFTNVKAYTEINFPIIGKIMSLTIVKDVSSELILPELYKLILIFIFASIIFILTQYIISKLRLWNK